MSPGKIVMVVIGVVLALLSFALVVGGATLLWAYGTQRDADGFFTTRTYELSTEWHAITTEDLEFGADPGDWWPSNDVATLKLEATGAAARLRRGRAQLRGDTTTCARSAGRN